MAKETKDTKNNGPKSEDPNKILQEAKAADPKNFVTDYWPSEGEGDDTDNAPLVTSDGTPRRYARLEPGATIFGHYMGCEVLMMPKFGKPEVREERAFYVLEVCNPPGYTGERPYGVKARRPRSDAIEIVPVGEIVYLGVAARLQPISLLSGLKYQPVVGIHVRGKDKTARGFNLWGFDWRAWKTDRPSLRALADTDDVAAMFAAQDRGLYAAENLFGIVIPQQFRELAERQNVKRISAGEEQVALPAEAGATQ